MKQLLLPDTYNGEPRITLTGRDFRHVAKVLRLRTGDTLAAVDAQGQPVPSAAAPGGRPRLRGRAAARSSIGGAGGGGPAAHAAPVLAKGSKNRSHCSPGDGSGGRAHRDACQRPLRRPRGRRRCPHGAPGAGCAGGGAAERGGPGPGSRGRGSSPPLRAPGRTGERHSSFTSGGWTWHRCTRCWRVRRER